MSSRKSLVKYKALDFDDQKLGKLALRSKANKQTIDSFMFYNAPFNIVWEQAMDDETIEMPLFQKSNARFSNKSFNNYRCDGFESICKRMMKNI